MKFIIHSKIKERAPGSLEWVRTFLKQYDTSTVGWLRIDFGREYRDKRGRLYRKYEGIYGRCWYPSEDQPTFRMSCQVPGPFPCEIETVQKPVYRNSDGSWPAAAKKLPGPVVKKAGSDRQWKRVFGKTIVNDLDEAIVWIVGHEAFHWLRATKQVPGRNTEAQADAFGDRQLAGFRENRIKAVSGAKILEVQWKQGLLFPELQAAAL